MTYLYIAIGALTVAAVVLGATLYVGMRDEKQKRDIWEMR